MVASSEHRKLWWLSRILIGVSSGSMLLRSSAHNLCLGLSQPFGQGLLHQLLAMDLVDAEGLNDCALGEDETRGRWTDRAFNKDITEGDEYGTLWMTCDSFYLEPMWCAHTESVLMLYAREKCACVRPVR